MRLNEITEKKGGYALKTLGVTRIRKEDIPATVQYVSNIIGIPADDMKTLGSVGKTATSGDIDVALDLSKYNGDQIHRLLLNTLGQDKGTYNAGTKIGSYAIPIAGDPANGLVQFDLMYVPNPAWAEFSYFSAGDESRYKGAIRNILLANVAKALDEPGVDAFVYDDNGDLIVRAGRGLSPSLGLKRMYQMRGKHKKTGAWLKTMKNVSPMDIKREFPDLQFDQGHWVIDDPKKVVGVLFGPDTKPSDVNTVEQIISLIKQRFSREKAQKIFDGAKERASKLADKMEIPPELQ